MKEAKPMRRIPYFQGPSFLKKKEIYVYKQNKH